MDEMPGIGELLLFVLGMSGDGRGGIVAAVRPRCARLAVILVMRLSLVKRMLGFSCSSGGYGLFTSLV